MGDNEFKNFIILNATEQFLQMMPGFTMLNLYNESRDLSKNQSLDDSNIKINPSVTYFIERIIFIMLNV